MLATSVVVPVYRSVATLETLVVRTREALGDCPHEIIFVDDGSPSATWETLTRLTERFDDVRALRLGRNFGQHNALLAGIRVARHPVIVTIDDDLQNPPEEIPTLLAALQQDRVDVVYGVAPVASHSWWRNWTSRVGKSAITRIMGAGNASQMSTFRAFRTDLRECFNVDLGPDVSIDALLWWSTDQFSTALVRHDERADGVSNYTLRRLLKYFIDIATGYSAVPLRLATCIGLCTASFGLGVLGWVAGRLLITGSSVPGFPFLASTIAIFAGAQLICLGVIGEYLAKVHFRVMRKPSYFVREEYPARVGTFDGHEPT